MRETEEQLPDLVQTESGLLRSPQHRQPVEHRIVVAPLAAHATRRLQDADLLVVTNRGGAQPDLSPDLGNGPLRHASIIGQLRKKIFEKSSCLQVDLKL